MIVSSATTGAAWFLDGLASIQARELKTQRELSSGHKIQDASDSPGQTPALVRLTGSLSSAQAWRTNLDTIASEAQAGDQSISSAIDAINSAKTLAAQGATSTSTAAVRQNLASQVQALQQQIVSSANASFGGRYIFGGDQDQSAPYALDPSSATGVDQLTTQASTRIIDNPSGQPVYQSLSASQIFDQRAADGTPAAANAFAALQNLSTALTNNDVAGIANALDSLGQVGDWLNQQQAYYGRAGNRIQAEQQTTDNNILSLQTQISGIRDADVAQAATDLTQETTAQQAALSAEAQIPRKSLFDYLG
jgi:flagellar hook-associated protein 3 FlgL